MYKTNAFLHTWLLLIIKADHHLVSVSITSVIATTIIAITIAIIIIAITRVIAIITIAITVNIAIFLTHAFASMGNPALSAS